ncbi:hypothetical protein ACJA23_00835 [Mycoplasma corogypsi]|uniref:hypothetical protein n=1 Tax=Mycoplasma corogypsi TaxID=2106 RepID=UPI00387393F8
MKQLKAKGLSDLIKKMHPTQIAYMLLWAFFILLLVIWVIITAVLNGNNSSLSDQAVANINATVALIMILDMFAAIVLTVVTHNYILKGKKLFSKGGK